MCFEIFLAIRYLRTPRRDFLAQFTALAAIFGIAFGVAAMIVAQAAANGFRAALQHKILEHTAHITIVNNDGEYVDDWQDLSKKIKNINGIKLIAPTSIENAFLFGKTNLSYAALKAVQSPKSQAQSSKSKIEVEIGKNLAEKVGLEVGDNAEILTANANSNQAFAPTTTVVTVGGIFSIGLYEYDSTLIRLSLEDAAKLTGKNEVAVSALEIKVVDIYESAELSEVIRKQLGAKFKVLDWQETNRPLFTALNLERRFALIVISLIVLIAALNIATTLVLVVNERKRDIAILKTCGASEKSIVFIFLCEGALLGAIGIIFGALFGLIICAGSNYFGWINLPPDVYSISEIVLEPNGTEILLTMLAALLLCLTASTFPAWAATKVKPLENLKN